MTKKIKIECSYKHEFSFDLFLSPQIHTVIPHFFKALMFDIIRAN